MELESAEDLAFELMSDFGLYYWKFKFDRAKMRFGLCDEHTKTISLSKHLVLINDIEVVENVILHEIAHALVGSKHKHNSLFQQKARDIGCKYITRYTSEDVNQVPKNVTALCPNCGHTYKKHRRPKGRRACGRCKELPFKNRLLHFQVTINTARETLEDAGIISQDENAKWHQTEKYHTAKGSILIN